MRHPYSDHGTGFLGIPSCTHSAIISTIHDDEIMLYVIMTCVSLYNRNMPRQGKVVLVIYLVIS